MLAGELRARVEGLLEQVRYLTAWLAVQRDCADRLEAAWDRAANGKSHSRRWFRMTLRPTGSRYRLPDDNMTAGELRAREAGLLKQVAELTAQVAVHRDRADRLEAAWDRAAKGECPICTPDGLGW
ncbi:MAG: hypothetical protein KGP10_00370 [Actinomycetales bacterium]|nr:hypothetical protein [Actinomycetales bacterium]